MKVYQLFLFTFLFSVFSGSQVEAQKVDFRLLYNEVETIYEVYAIPDFSDNKFFVGGGSQMSLVLPADTEDVPLQINTVAGGLWTDNSRVFAPESDHIHDFHGIASNGSLVRFVEGEPKLLFTFELPGGACRSDVRLFENAGDLGSNAPGMNGSDFNNFFANVFEPLKNTWVRNENVLDADCAHAPSVAPETITMYENTPASVCLPIVDPNIGDSFDVSICPSTNQVVEGVFTMDIVENELCVEYVPSEGFIGQEEVCVTICDQTGLCNTSTVLISVISEPVYSTFSAVANSCQNDLSWTVYNPSAFSRFELERSKDGVEFETLESFNSNNQTTDMVFDYADENARFDYFYRLRLVSTNGTDRYSDVVLVTPTCEGGIDPVVNLLATPNACENYINWTFNSEVEFDYYELERSSDGENFAALTTFESETQASLLSLQFTDKKTVGDHFYRIRMVMSDGSEVYSESAFVESECQLEDGFALYPNPVSQSDPTLNVKFMAETEKVNLVVMDVLGRVIRRMTLNVDMGMNSFSFDVADFAIGTYFLAIEGKENLAKSFVKVDKRF